KKLDIATPFAFSVAVRLAPLPTDSQMAACSSGVYVVGRPIFRFGRSGCAVEFIEREPRTSAPGLRLCRHGGFQGGLDMRRSLHHLGIGKSNHSIAEAPEIDCAARIVLTLARIVLVKRAVNLDNQQ